MPERASAISFSTKSMTKGQSRDTGMAMVLLLLLIYLKPRRDGLLEAALILHVMNMIVPRVYAPGRRVVAGAVAFTGHGDVQGAAIDFVFWFGDADRSSAAAYGERFSETA